MARSKERISGSEKRLATKRITKFAPKQCTKTFTKERYTNDIESFTLVGVFSRIETSKFVQICYHEGTEDFVHVPVKLRNVCLNYSRNAEVNLRTEMLYLNLLVE